VQSDEAREQWAQPSLLDGYTVGSLIGHTFNTSEAIERYLDDPEPEEPAQPAASYYAPVPFPDDAPDLHADIRERAAKVSDVGRDQLVADLAQLSERLQARFAVEPANRKVKIRGWSVLTLDGYLETRILELVIHADDVAESIGHSVEMPADALSITARHLAEIARQRHGDLAVIRALARRDRYGVDALRVL
jgi:uncharacterized protein (TIGR03083 family)